jgi:hypothetical protein
MEIFKKKLSWSLRSIISTIAWMNWWKPWNTPARIAGVQGIFEPSTSRIQFWTITYTYLVKTYKQQTIKWPGNIFYFVKPFEGFLPCLLCEVTVHVTACLAQHRVSWSIVLFNWNEVNVFVGVAYQWLIDSHFKEWKVIMMYLKELALNYIDYTDVSEGTNT